MGGPKFPHTEMQNEFAWPWDNMMCQSPQQRASQFLTLRISYDCKLIKYIQDVLKLVDDLDFRTLAKDGADNPVGRIGSLYVAEPL